MLVMINVTEQDIERGERQNCMACPVSLAMSRETGELWEVYALRAFRVMSRQPVSFPEPVSNRIRMFDAGGVMRPFSFDVEI